LLKARSAARHKCPGGYGRPPLGVIRSAPTPLQQPEPTATARRLERDRRLARACRRSRPRRRRAGAALNPWLGCRRPIGDRPSCSSVLPSGVVRSDRPTTWRRGSAFDRRLVLPTSELAISAIASQLRRNAERLQHAFAHTSSALAFLVRMANDCPAGSPRRTALHPATRDATAAI
jgi:hypothetical protein